VGLRAAPVVRLVRALAHVGLRPCPRSSGGGELVRRSSMLQARRRISGVSRSDVDRRIRGQHARRAGSMPLSPYQGRQCNRPRVGPAGGGGQRSACGTPPHGVAYQLAGTPPSPVTASCGQRLSGCGRRC
jgi:hypothetical protein